MALVCGGAAGVNAQVATTPTMSPAALSGALTGPAPTPLLEVTSVVIRNGQPGQFGTYTAFDKLPVSIRDGVVLSSGSVANLAPFPEAHNPDYQPSSPPAQVNSQMTPDNPDGTMNPGGTTEFDAYGIAGGNIQNFAQSFDVAAIEVHFTLEEDSQIKFDFIFGSVEFPYYTSQFTDAFLVFLDGTTVDDQITFDANNSAVQVGSSFAGLETTADVNTAFSYPHGLIHHLTTTTARLDSGDHVLIFEVGDVNDHILDSAVFISRLRAEAGVVGTEPTEDCTADFTHDDVVDATDIFIFLDQWFAQNGQTEPSGGPDLSADFNDDDTVNATDIFVFLDAWFFQLGGECS